MKPPLVPVSTSLFDTPFDFEFFQAVRLLHLILNDRPGVGRIAQPGDEPVRFKVRLDGASPGDDHGVDSNADGAGEIRQPRMYQLIRQKGRARDRLLEIGFL